MSSFFENVYEYSVLYKQIIYCWKKYTFLGANLWHLSYTGWFKKMDSISYVYISWTIQGMWTISITFERGGEVKPSVPCRKFTACKRTQKWRGSRHFRQNSLKKISRPQLHLPLLGFARVVSDVRDTWWRELERSNHWSSRLGVWRAAGNDCL